LKARIPRNQQKVRQFGVLFPNPQFAFAGNRKRVKESKEEGKRTQEIMRKEILGVLCPSLGCDFFERRGEKRIDVGTLLTFRIFFFRMVSYVFGQFCV